MVKYKNKAFCIFLCLFLLLSFTACTTGDNQEKEVEQKESVAVEVQKPVKGSIAEVKEFSGKLQPLSEVTVTIKLPGKVEAIHVDVGDEIQEGDLLMELDTSDVELQVDQAQAAYNAAKKSKDALVNQVGKLDKQISDLKKQKKKIEAGIQSMKDNLKDQLDQGLITQEIYQQQLNMLDPSKADIQLKKLEEDYVGGKITLDQYNQFSQPLNMVKGLSAIEQQIAAVEQAKAALPSMDVTNAQVKQAEAGVNIAKAQLKNGKVYAPVGGTVASRNVDVGEIASQAVPPFVIVDMSKMVMEFGVTDMDVVRFEKGMKASVRIDALEGENIEGTIVMVSPVPDVRTGNYPIRIELDNSDRKLKVGMFSRVLLDMERHEDALQVPIDAVLDENGQKFVYVNQNGTAHKVVVETGLTDGNMIEIISGIQEDQEIIIKGQEYLSEGTALLVNRGESK